MTVGIAAASANSALNTLMDSSFIKLHTGDPTSAGAGAPSGETTRKAATFNTASAGSKTLNGALTWTSWLVGNNGEVISHISAWSASTAGTFWFSAALTTAKTMNTGDTLSLNSITGSITPIAA